MVGEDGEQRADRQQQEPEGALAEGVHANPPDPRIYRQVAKKSGEDERLEDGAASAHERARVSRLRDFQIALWRLAVGRRGRWASIFCARNCSV